MALKRPTGSETIPEPPKPKVDADQSLAPIETEETEDTGPISKTEAIRRCIAAGIENPSSGVEWISKRFNLVVSPQSFSTTKSEIKKKGGVVVRRPGRPMQRPTSPLPPQRMFTSSPSTSPYPAPTNAIDLGLASEVKALVRRYGAEAVTAAVTLFAD